jgi:hypothetical protein
MLHYFEKAIRMAPVTIMSNLAFCRARNAIITTTQSLPPTSAAVRLSVHAEQTPRSCGGGIEGETFRNELTGGRGCPKPG